MICEHIILENGHGAELTVYLQSVGGEFRNIDKRPLILILPGGGYRMCSDREADPIAFPYLAAGYQAAVLRYTVGEKEMWPYPLEDYEAAMEYLVEKEEEWAIDTERIAVIGFSAGGHLAGCAATIAAHKPKAVIMGYPVLTEEWLRKRGHVLAPDVVQRVDERTCPCFLFATRDDPTVSIRNTIQFAAALECCQIPFECHIYSFGPHGVSTGDPSVLMPRGIACTRVPDWVNDSIEWLREMMKVWE